MDLLHTYATEVEQELTLNILPFYAQHMVDREQGGFYGTISNDLVVEPLAPKGLVQHSRLLWSYAYAARQLQQGDYLKQAECAYTFLLDHFVDKEHGGLFWFVDAGGRPFSTNKITYGQAFAIYGFSEYFLATGDEGALQTAVSFYHALEKQTWDTECGGYFEAYLANWTRDPAINVDEVTGIVDKTMNTHLHLLEAYTNLLRAWDNDQLRGSLRTLINIMLTHIIDQATGHMKLHFSRDWQSLTTHVSYGHDIEASWLLVEAAEVLGDDDLLASVQQVALHMAQVAHDEALDADGSLRYEDHDTDRVWWAQAEAMVGFFNAYQLSGRSHFLEASWHCWQYVQTSLIDRENGEWFCGRKAAGNLMPGAKADAWKTPYHNGRSCLEIMQRTQKIKQEQVINAPLRI